MKKRRLTRLSLIVLLLAALAVAAIIGRRFFIAPPPVAPEAPEAAPSLPEGSPLALPSMPRTPATMSESERQAAIEAAVQDAAMAARASGQSEREVEEVAAQARERALRVFSPGGATDATVE